MAQQNSDELQPLMVKLHDALHDDRDLLHRTELERISNILAANKDKITSQSPELEKKDKLPELLRKIDEALEQCLARSKQQQPAAKSKKKTLPSVSDCNPFKSRSSLSLSVEALLRQTIDILGDAPPPPPAAAGGDHNAGEPAVTELYEWTTSYVDESRIYGWNEEADKVVDALVGVEEADKDKVLFRAAGITGIHGSGKTALAQKVFVHDRIKDAFPLRLWVCVGPPCVGLQEPEDNKIGLLYRILDNLGLDTAKVESIVDNCDAVKKSMEKSSKVESIVDNSDAVKKSKIGVLLFILYVTLYKTGYLIVFDDIRAYDDWYTNLMLGPPTDGGEWNDRLAYGLPKARKSAVLVTCRKEDDARTMVRTGNVFRPPELSVDDGWKLFEREYGEAKKKAKEKEEKKQGEKVEEQKEEEKAIDELYKELAEMKKEIIGKCLGLPVAIVEAAKGFAVLKPEKDDDPPVPKAEGQAAAADQPAATSKTEPAQSSDAHQPAN